MRAARVLWFAVFFLLVSCGEAAENSSSGSDSDDSTSEYAEYSEPDASGSFSEPPANTSSTAESNCTNDFRNPVDLDPATAALITACIKEDASSLLIVNASPGVLRVRPLVAMTQFSVAHPPSQSLAAELMRRATPYTQDTAGSAVLIPGASLVATGAHGVPQVQVEPDFEASQTTYVAQLVGSYVEGKLQHPSDRLLDCVEAVDGLASDAPFNSWGNLIGSGLQAAPECRSTVTQLRDVLKSSDDAAPANVADDIARYSDDLARPSTELTIIGDFGTHVRTSLMDDLLRFTGRAIQVLR